ncbi:hypothetical protein Tco_0721404 [Tanacetum coccineum]
MKAHCIALELKYQNQALKSGKHGQILNEISNKSKIKKEIDVLETMNIELEHSVAKLLKENETLKKHYKDFYDSIKITRSKTIEQTTSLLANNADLKAQIQEKGFCNYYFKNDLRKLKRNSVDNKFAKTSVLGKPFASQVDVNKNLSRPVTQHYLSKRRESTFAKPNHMIASSESRNISKNMPRFSSNDMVHNHYLDEARKKTQERDRNSKTSVMPSARLQNTTNGSTLKPRSNNQTSGSLPVSKSSCVMITTVPIVDHSKNSNSFSDSKHFVCSTCQKCVFNANHDACITKILKEVNSRAKRHRFSPNKTFVVYEKTSPKSDLRWKPTGRMFKTVGLRWVPTGKILAPCTSKDDSESTHGSNVDISNIHECKQTLDSVVAEKANISETSVEVDSKLINRMPFDYNSLGLELQCQMTFEHNGSSLAPQCKRSSFNRNDSHNVNDRVDSLFGPLFDEYFNGENQVVSKSSVVTTADASDKRQQQPDSTSSTSTLATSVTDC